MMLSTGITPPLTQITGVLTLPTLTPERSQLVPGKNLKLQRRDDQGK